MPADSRRQRLRRAAEFWMSERKDDDVSDESKRNGQNASARRQWCQP
jgi:hypothetical protein